MHQSAAMWILAFQRERSINRANPSCDILRMDALDVREMFQEGAKQAFGEHADLTFHSFPMLYSDLTWGKVQVFDAESYTFHQPQPTPIE